MSELQGLQLHFSEFAARDCEIVGIVSDPVAANANVVADLDLAYRILADPDLRTINAWGLKHPSGARGLDISRPASFLIDRDGVIRWRDLTENYRIRPHPETILRALDSTGALAAAGLPGIG